MNDSHLPLKQVDRVEVLTLMDNYSDSLLGDTEVVKRPNLIEGDEVPRDALVAEHGLSLLIRLFKDGDKRTILMDTGHTEFGVPHNMDKLGIDPKGIDMIVMSHAHMDHTGSLHTLLDRMGPVRGGEKIPLVLHPDAFMFPRYKELPDGKRVRFPRTLVKEDLEKRQVQIIETREPTLIMGGLVLVTGEVERKTGFEKGLPGALVEKDGKMEQDPLSDDQSLVLHLKGKGLVVISGCSHAGIVNTVRYARELAGVETIHAVLGGFHLSGPPFEPIIDRTIDEMRRFDPKVLVPMHCTGWKAMQRFAETFSDAFVLNSVGSTITLS